MKALDGSDFYQWGVVIRQLMEMPDDLPQADAHELIITGHATMQKMSQADIDIGYVAGDLKVLLYTLQPATTEYPTYETARQKTLLAEIRSRAARFEPVLLAALASSATFHVVQKKGYDTKTLIYDGLTLFADGLSQKVPEATTDIKNAMRCVALELFTSAAFHLHRANEAVLRKYYVSVSGGAPAPTRKNPDYRPAMGDYLIEMENKGWGSPELLASLKDLKNLHRNFIAHPDMEVTELDEIDSLLGQVKTSIYHMLKAIS